MLMPNLVPTYKKDLWPLYLFGNYSIQNSRFFVGSYPRSSTPLDVQRLPIARGVGSTVVNVKAQEKVFDLHCQIYSDNSLTSFRLNTQKILEEFKRVMSYNDRYYRIMPYGSYIILHNPISTSGWSLSSEGTNLSIDTDEFQLDSASLKFDSTSAGAGYVTISSTAQTSIDLSTYLANNTLYLPQFERWVFIPDETEVTSIDIRVGSSSSNYYEKVGISTNYEGKPLEQGWNLLSVPFSLIATTGTPTNSSLGSYQYVKFNYSATSPSLTSFRVDGLLLTSDAYVRNYRCYRTGDIKVDNNPHREVAVELDLSLLNYTGYAEATQTETLFAVSAVTSLSNTQMVTLNGNRDQLPRLNLGLNSVTNLNQLKLTNLNNSQYIYFANSWVNNDNIVIDNFNKVVTRNGQSQDFTNGKLPVFGPGRNKVKLEVIQSANTLIQQTVSNSEELLGGGDPDYGALGQSFTASVSGTLQTASLYMRAANVQASSFAPLINICADNSGSPGSVLASYQSAAINNSSSNSWVDFPFSLSLTSTIKYWIVLTYSTPFGYVYPGYSVGRAYWAYQNSDVYVSNYRSRYIIDNHPGSVWSNQTGSDHAFKVSIAPVPSTNIDWSMSYKRLYN